ncbi:MAG: carbon-nitrogen hydrolase [Candidatus Methylacidiphilales bacterium]
MSQNRTVNVGLVQSVATPSLEKNIDRAIKRCHLAAEQGAQIICLQELYRSYYPCQEENPDFFDWAETIPGPSTEALSQVAKEKEVVIIASLFEKRTAGLYHNTAAVINADGSLLGTYRKMHIPDDPGYYEKFYFTPGDLGFKSFQTRYAKIGVLVCWDQWFPEAARLTALKGAEILFYPTAIGWNPKDPQDVQTAQHSAWETIQRSHAVANGVYVVSVNRTGQEGHTKFWGQSFVSDPFGEIIEKASVDEEEIITVSCDLNEVEVTRRHWPFLRDRRIDMYDGLTQRYLDAQS